jgi:hypothetical protein
MSLSFILVPGPPVRASSWEPTARHLRQAGYETEIPDVLDNAQTPPPWNAWTTHLLQRITPCDEAVLVGHSSATPLVASLAATLPCRGIILVDGEVPPARGPAAPVRPALRDFINSIAGSDGALPVWSQWFGADARRRSLVGLDRLARDAKAFADFEHALPTLSVGWFDDTIALAGWDHVPAGYIQCSPLYDHAAEEARRRGWPVVTLQGTHLHPTLEPAETMRAIVSLAHQLAGVRP